MKAKNLTIFTVIMLLSTVVGFANEGDSPLEAYFLPHDTELSGTIGSEFMSDYYKVIVPSTGRLIIRLYDIDLQDTNDELHIALMSLSQNSVGTEYTMYINKVAESKNDSDTPDVIDIPDITRGIYFIQVWPEHPWPSWDGVHYKIKAEFTVFPPVVKDDIGDQKKYALPIVNQLETVCTLDGDNDVDYFECHLPYNTNLTLKLTDIQTDNVDMEVYTASDMMIGSASETGNSDELLYLPDLVPGQYFIKIFGTGTTPYTFTATQEFASATDIFDDVGNDLAHSMPLLPGNPSVFCLQSYNTDNDYFSFYQPEDGLLTVDIYDLFLWDSSDDLQVQVLDEYGNVVGKSDNESGIPEHIELDLVRGQYFIAVLGEGNWPAFDGAIYTIKVQTNGSDVGNAFNQAMQIHAIPYGTETYGYPYIGLIDYSGDEDFFQVVLKDSGFIYLEVDRMMYGNVDVQLFDANYNLLQTSANSGIQSDVIYVDDLDAGVYFIKVYSSENEISQYRLTPTISTPTSITVDDIGDSVTRAFPLVPYRRVNCYLWNDNTDDYFIFTLSKKNNFVRIHINNQHIWDTHDDIRLFVYDASGWQIAFSDTAYLIDEYIELENLEAGIYYIKVNPEHNWPQMDTGQYCITVETDIAPLPSAELDIASDVQGIPGEIIYVPVILDNSLPNEITSISVGIQFDPNILEPIGVSKTGLTLDQWDAQIRYSMSVNTISVSMDNFSTIESGELLNLIFKIKSSASAGDISTLTILTSILNGAIVPGADGLVTVIDAIP